MPYLKLTAEQLIETLKQFNHTELHVHHTWRPNHSNFNGKNHESVQNGMRNYHVNTNGWDDIAQHVTLFPDGSFLTGRNFGKQPVSIKGYNGSGSKIPFACEMVGDFDIGKDKLDGKQLDSILKLAKFFDDQKKYIRFHRENAPKTCPGSGIDKNEFMKAVKNFKGVKVMAEKEWDSKTKFLSEWVKKEGISDGKNPYAPVTQAYLWEVARNVINKLEKK
ncbi:N-acetylmuramoyl-L-alanine amidase [Cytobacillus oceanisediminis]|uniref:N-acetylmuramoyl-L-alanine amidase n=1 Tax=Cytobacillus oceanisediminis TaxID=665099 RepID=UPI001C21C2FE|nr:N-acetylmuramoyl-L-alanine amidase [Cytobacillus oceanisediminis]MBU8770344.1 hypothetical protein [Cytobacillus oceanisediminis]